jgi:hypothetical protein
VAWASELYRPSERRLSAKLVPTFTDRGCHVVSVTDPYGRILGFFRPEPLLFLSSTISLRTITLDYWSLVEINWRPTQVLKVCDHDTLIQLVFLWGLHTNTNIVVCEDGTLIQLVFLWRWHVNTSSVFLWGLHTNKYFDLWGWHIDTTIVFLTMRRWYSQYVSGHYPPSCFNLFKAVFRTVHVRWDPCPTAWRVLGLRMEERPPDMEVSCEYIE